MACYEGNLSTSICILMNKKVEEKFLDNNNLRHKNISLFMNILIPFQFILPYQYLKVPVNI